MNENVQLLLFKRHLINFFVIEMAMNKSLIIGGLSMVITIFQTDRVHEKPSFKIM